MQVGLDLNLLALQLISKCYRDGIPYRNYNITVNKIKIQLQKELHESIQHIYIKTKRIK